MSPLFLQVASRPWTERLRDLVIQFWPILLTAALGGTAVYLLLPRVRRYPPLWGAAAAALALVGLAWLVVRSDWMWLETLLFYTFSGIAITFGGLMLTQRNPIHAALSFAMVVLSTCGLFLLQAAPFLMAATIIVYAGAIVVTFVFVIMLAQQAGHSSADQRSREPFLASVAGFVLLAAILCVLNQNYGTSVFDEHVERAGQVAKATTVQQWQQILDDDNYFKQFRGQLYGGKLPPRTQIASPAAEARQQLYLLLEEAELSWNALKPPRQEPQADDPPRPKPTAKQLQDFRERFAQIRDLGIVVRHGQGALQPDKDLKLSNSSGTPANAVVKLNANGKPEERLPAANVAGLGKSLFTDYLLAVELAGTLLLIATIGAIAIAGRRPEGLR